MRQPELPDDREGNAMAIEKSATTVAAASA